MKDVAGQDLSVGDRAAISITGYRTMTVGTIIRFTPKGMFVQWQRAGTKWNGKPNEPEDTFRNPEMVCRVGAP